MSSDGRSFHEGTWKLSSKLFWFGAILLLVVCSIGSTVTAGTQTPQQLDILRMTDDVLAQVSALRGLAVRKPVVSELHSEASLRSYIAGRLREEYPGDMLEREQRLLAMLGLLPAGFDLASAVERLYTSQTAGYYDPHKKILYLSESLSTSFQMPTLAHELTHALQDQHFQIGNYMNPDRQRQDDDQQLAIMGLVEGDATGVMLAILSGSPDGEAWTESISLLQDDMLEGLASFSDGTLPSYLIRLLSFPYRHGTPFVARLYQEGGWEAVSAAYARPPKSTEQVLHPERYAPSEDVPTLVSKLLLPEQIASRELYYDLVLGEFVTRLILEPGLGNEEAARTAAGWDGDRVALYLGKGGGLLVWLSVWDSDEEAAEFAEALESNSHGGIAESRGARVVRVQSENPRMDETQLRSVVLEMWEAWDRSGS